MRLSQGIAVLAAAAALQACAPKELILEGDRLDPRDVLQGAEAAPLTGAVAVPINLPASRANAEWTHRGGLPTHALFNAAIGQGTTRVWSADVGQGAGRKHRITADPVVGAGRVYTMDSRATVVATGTNGATLWSADLTPSSDRADDASGGGIAYADGRVYVTTGFGELIALDAATGAVAWRQRFDVAVGGAPTVSGGIVYVVARDSSAWAVRASDGKVQWQLPGTPSPTGVTGVSAPAVNDRLVVFPFPSGDMIAALRQGGLTLWQGRVAGTRLGRAYATVVDLTGDPVIAQARRFLAELERGSQASAQPQLSLFDAPASAAASAEPAVDEAAEALKNALSELDPDALSPREAHAALYRLRELLG